MDLQPRTPFILNNDFVIYSHCIASRFVKRRRRKSIGTLYLFALFSSQLSEENFCPNNSEEGVTLQVLMGSNIHQLQAAQPMVKDNAGWSPATPGWPQVSHLYFSAILWCMKEYPRKSTIVKLCCHECQ